MMFKSNNIMVQINIKSYGDNIWFKCRLESIRDDRLTDCNLLWIVDTLRYDVSDLRLLL